MDFAEFFMFFMSCLGVTGAIYVAFKHSKMMDELDNMQASISIKESFYKQRMNELFNKLNNLHDGFKNLQGKRGTVPTKTFTDINAEFDKMKASLNALIEHCK